VHEFPRRCHAYVSTEQAGEGFSIASLSDRVSLLGVIADAAFDEMHGPGAAEATRAMHSLDKKLGSQSLRL
jgi:hypothetical protein